MHLVIRVSLVVLAAFALGVLLPETLQAQVRGTSQLSRFKPGREKPTEDPTGPGITASNYQVTQTAGGIVSGTTQLTGFANLDDGTAPIVLPFAYTLYDQTFTTANVSTNGNVQFVSNSNDYGQFDVCMPLGQFNYAIFPHWGDLVISGANEGVFTSVSGSSPNRIFNIEWRASLIGNAPGSLNFEIRLYEGQTRFDLVYGTVPGGGVEATAGVERAQGSTFTEFSCHQNALRNGSLLIFTGTADAALFIAGRVTDSDGLPITGVSVNLTGTSAAMVTTDGTGTYSFNGLTSGGTYTVTATQAGSTFFPASRSFGGGNRVFNGNFIVNFIRTVPVAPGDVLISEFRPCGPDAASALNDFVEIVNNTNHGITVNVTDGSSGWLVQASSGSTGFPIPISFLIANGTSIPAHGHYLAANSSGYNLQPYGTPDVFYDGDLPDGAGVALFSTTNSGSLDAMHVLDAAGFSTEPNPIYREGLGLPSPGANAGNFSFVRRLTSGLAQDTNDNASDFAFVSTTGGSFGGVQSQLGAPGPKNTASPIQRNATIKASAIDPAVAITSPPNRTRDFTAVTNGTQGTLNIRRRFTNQTGVPITRLRFRVVDITTLNTPNPGGAQADLRAINSVDVVVSTSTGSQTVRGLTLEQAPDGFGGFVLAQPSGGGLNSSLAAGIITVGQPLAPSAFINVEFKLGVMAPGKFRFFVNVEALP